jgi:hypothetical protein
MNLIKLQSFDSLASGLFPLLVTALWWISRSDHDIRFLQEKALVFCGAAQQL